MNSILAIDTETGGLCPSVNPLLSIGAHHPQLGDFSAVMWPDPEMDVDPVAARKNGYTPELWEKKGAVSLADAMASFQRWLAAIPDRFTPLAHNAAFDRSFIEYAERVTGIGMPWLDRRWECSQAATAFMMRAGVIDAESASLDGLCAWAGIPRPAIHDALEDARACHLGYTRLLQAAADRSRPLPLILSK